jgi:hypothetical protein
MNACSRPTARGTLRNINLLIALRSCTAISRDVPMKQKNHRTSSDTNRITQRVVHLLRLKLARSCTAISRDVPMKQKTHRTSSDTNRITQLLRLKLARSCTAISRDEKTFSLLVWTKTT